MHDPLFVVPQIIRQQQQPQQQQQRSTTRPQLKDYQNNSSNSNAAILCVKCRAIDRLPGSELCGPCEMKEKYHM